MVRRRASGARVLAVALLAALALVLGTLQALASVALRERAQSGSWVALVPPGAAVRADAFAERFPVPQMLRLAFARGALAAGDDARAERDARALAPSRDRLALFGALAHRRGDLRTAARDDEGAGDYVSLADDLSALAARGDVPLALELQRSAVARLDAERTRPDALAEAQYRLGILEEAQAEMLRAQPALRSAHQGAAARAYAQAEGLAPLDERYVLAAGNQALNMGAWSTAAAAFARGRALDPTSGDPLAGLGDLALRRGDERAARGYLARARALTPESAAVVRLAAKLRS